jgi:hypothetical protein
MSLTSNLNAKKPSVFYLPTEEGDSIDYAPRTNMLRQRKIKRPTTCFAIKRDSEEMIRLSDANLVKKTGQVNIKIGGHRLN